MLLKENYKRKNEKSWSLWLLPLLLLSCFILSAQSFAITKEEDSFAETQSKKQTQLSAKTQASTISVSDLEVKTKEIISEVPEFIWMQKETKKRGLKIWLFGESASSLLHYAIEEILLEKGVKDVDHEGFEKDSKGERNYTDIFGPKQGMVFVVDGDFKKSNKFILDVTNRYPYLLGAKRIIEAFLLRDIFGDKQALLNNPDILNQKTDSNSVELISLNIKGKPGEMKEGENRFLKDILAKRISYYNDEHHKETTGKDSETKPVQGKEVTSESIEISVEQYLESLRDENFIIDKAEINEVIKILKSRNEPYLWGKWFSLKISNQYPELVEALIEKGSNEALKWLAQHVRSESFWQKHPDLLKALIEKGDNDVLRLVAQHILSESFWQKHPEFIEAIIKRGSPATLKVVEKILSEAGWENHPRLLELCKGNIVLMENLKKALEVEEKKQKTCS